MDNFLTIPCLWLWKFDGVLCLNRY